MLYDYDYEINNVQERLKNLKEGGNRDLILRFMNKLFAEGLSKPRVVKYANHLKVVSEKMGKSFLEVTPDDIVTFLSELEQSDYSIYTKRDYKAVLRRFFRFLGKEELVKDVKTTVRESQRKLPEEILTKSEVRKMIEVADHPRDKAVIAVLYEGGLRIGELASVRMKNIEFDEYGAVIKVQGKTGERRVRLVTSASLLAKWMEMHPGRENKEASLWVNLSTNYKKEGVTYQGIAQNIKRIARKAGVKKRITPHLFRHSRATHLAGDLTEAEMDEYFGWVHGSNMPATYVHLSGRDVDDKILEIHGLKPRGKEKQDEMRPIECPRCQYINAPVSRYCGRCGTVLDEKDRIKLEVKGVELMKHLPDLAAGNPQVLENMKRMIELAELFNKNPNLINEMRKMIEG